MEKGDKVIKRLLVLISVLLAVILVVELTSLSLLNSLKNTSNLQGELGTYSPTAQYTTSSSSSSSYQSSSSVYTQSPRCTPRCGGKYCGAPDECGGICGTCPPGLTCRYKDGLPVCACVPNCAGKTCGDDRCGGSCGTCRSDKSCITAGDGAGTCRCNDNCVDKRCGFNDCGENICGSCPAGQICEDTKCVSGSNCSESDGGKSWYQSGTTSVGTNHQEDYCVSSTKLHEFFCSSGKIAGVDYSCNCHSGGYCVWG